MKTRIKSYLSITKKEWNGMVVLVILIALVIAAPSIYQFFRKDKAINVKDFDKAIAQLNLAVRRDSAGKQPALTYEKVQHPAMFSFDPNNLSIAQWQQLGLSSKQAAIIKHYEVKGGKFYSKADVKKIYSITADDYKRLEPYITIPVGKINSKNVIDNIIVEVNSADSQSLIALKGIGLSFAGRIISYRNRLGGFCAKDQLKEVYGIDSVKYAEIKDHISVDPNLVKKININNISFNQLRIFPYLKYKQVNAIIEYRTQHGPFGSMADMAGVVLLDENLLSKIKPYIAFK